MPINAEKLADVVKSVASEAEAAELVAQLREKWSLFDSGDAAKLMLASQGDADALHTVHFMNAVIRSILLSNGLRTLDLQEGIVYHPVIYPMACEVVEPGRLRYTLHPQDHIGAVNDPRRVGMPPEIAAPYGTQAAQTGADVETTLAELGDAVDLSTENRQEPIKGGKV